MRIAIYGGSFNPIHIGHTSLAKALLQQNLADEVWLLVSPQNPLKKNNTDDYEHRLNMARLATNGIDRILISDFERNLPVPSYTSTTLAELSKKFPQHVFSLVIGADNWKRMNQWHKYNEILKSYDILIYQRPGYTIKTENYPEAKSITVINTPLYDISSTEIRNHKKMEMVHPDVLEYIQKNNLYN